MISRIDVGERLVLTVWVGALWSIGFIAAPILFAVLDDRSLAGTLAGEMFRAVAFIGLVCGTLLLVMYVVRSGWRQWRFAVVVFMLALVAAGQFGIAPMVAELRSAGLSGTEQFGRLHGVASSLYLLTSLLGLGLVIAGSPRRDV